MVVVGLWFSDQCLVTVTAGEGVGAGVVGPQKRLGLLGLIKALLLWCCWVVYWRHEVTPERVVTVP